MPENQTVWKSNNQGVKEETFIQTGRRGEDRQPRWRGLMVRQTGMGEAGAGGPGKAVTGRVGSPTFECG